MRNLYARLQQRLQHCLTTGDCNSLTRPCEYDRECPAVDGSASRAKVLSVHLRGIAGCSCELECLEHPGRSTAIQVGLHGRCAHYGVHVEPWRFVELAHIVHDIAEAGG